MNREIGSLPASAKSTPCAPEASTTWLAWVILGLTPPTVATRRKPSSSMAVTMKPISSMCAVSRMRLPPGAPFLTQTRLPISSAQGRISDSM